MRYAVIVAGKITGSTDLPNQTSQTPIDTNSKRWTDYIAKRDRVMTPREKMEDSVARDPAIKAIAQELESRYPGFIAAAKARL